MAEPWLAELQQRQEVLFLRDWAAHVRGLNARLALSGRSAFVESRWPPLWFQGDIESSEAGRWVAVMSLNPKTASDYWLDWLEKRAFTAESYWDYLRHVNLEGLDYFNRQHEYFYWRFDRRLVQLIARAVGERIPASSEEIGYKRRRMRSFETIPYASHEYHLAAGTLRSLLDTDDGCIFAGELARQVIANGRPAAVLLNGRDAMNTFTEVWRGGVELHTIEYASESHPSRTLKHWEGALHGVGGSIPVIGFRQLGRASHPSNSDVAQLARYIARATGAPVID